MNNLDFTTSDDPKALSDEVICLKMMLTLILKEIGQAGAGKIILNMERAVTKMEESEQAKLFANTIVQIKHAYRQ